MRKSFKFFASIIPNRKRGGIQQKANTKGKTEIDETSLCKFSSASSLSSLFDDESVKQIEISYDSNVKIQGSDRKAKEDDKEDDKEIRRLLSLEKRLKDIEKNKKLDMENVENWKNLQKWRIVQQHQLGRQDKEEVQQKASSTDACKPSRRFVLDHLDKNHRYISDMCSSLDNKLQRLTKANSRLEKEHKRYERKTQKLRKQIASEKKRQKSLKALENQLQTLVQECRTHQETYETDKYIKFIYQKTVDDILLKLQFECTDDALMDHVTTLAFERTKNADNNMEEEEAAAATTTETWSSSPTQHITPSQQQWPVRLSDMRPSLVNKNESLYDLFVSDSSLSVEIEDPSNSAEGEDYIIPIASCNPIVNQVGKRISRRSSI